MRIWWRSQWWPHEFIEPDPRVPDVCPSCGGLGYRLEELDEDRLPVTVPCECRSQKRKETDDTKNEARS